MNIKYKICLLSIALCLSAVGYSQSSKPSSSQEGRMGEVEIEGRIDVTPGQVVREVKDIDSKEEPEKIFMAVEQPAQFPGGMEGLQSFLMQNLRYPEKSYAGRIEGRVIVKFIVEKDGRVADPQEVRSVNPSLDVEALRVICEMPRWTPARNNGKPVRSYFTLPIVFRIPK